LKRKSLLEKSERLFLVELWIKGTPRGTQNRFRYTYLV
jgi:hypothetical protein